MASRTIMSLYLIILGWFWDTQWRNIKIELNKSRLEASSRHSSNKDWNSLAGNIINYLKI